jgi:hypothetical protein
MTQFMAEQLLTFIINNDQEAIITTQYLAVYGGGASSPVVHRTRGNRCSCEGVIPRPLAGGIAEARLLKIYWKGIDRILGK